MQYPNKIVGPPNNGIPTSGWSGDTYWQFDGWDTDLNTVPTSNMTVTGIWHAAGWRVGSGSIHISKKSQALGDVVTFRNVTPGIYTIVFRGAKITMDASVSSPNSYYVEVRLSTVWYDPYSHSHYWGNPRIYGVSAANKISGCTGGFFAQGPYNSEGIGYGTGYKYGLASHLCNSGPADITLTAGRVWGIPYGDVDGITKIGSPDILVGLMGSDNPEGVTFSWDSMELYWVSS